MWWDKVHNKEGQGMRTVFTINIWDYIDISMLNDALDEYREQIGKKGVAADIKYSCVKAYRDGRLTISANHKVEPY
jgi:hypothetical protein